jgi:RsiW-degrading membrane proteinase PrsW (M82 family)
MVDAPVAMAISAFIPCLLFAALARWTEIQQRQSLRSVIAVFAMGATVSVVLALALELGGQLLLANGLGMDSEGTLAALIGAVLLAPFIEEYTKSSPIRLIRFRSEFSEVEDGLVYGAAAGFGFAATENLLYFLVAWRRSLLLPPGLGFTSLLATVVVRSIGAACLHGAASSIVGYGIARSTFLRASWLGDYGKAVALHAVYNLAIFSFSYLLVCGLGPLCPAPLVFSLVIGIGFFKMTLSRIRKLDEEPNVQPVYEWGGKPPDAADEIHE